uniref:Prokineticin 1 n=1 Tax=Neogobius melanostomus TaxID=47308 RepID=A0A8C6WS66_9GOBI
MKPVSECHIITFTPLRYLSLIFENELKSSSSAACERDVQCGLGLCCAVSLWLRGLRMCVPSGVEGDECHPFSHKAPYHGKRQHHTCPCLPHLVCTRYDDNKYRCTEDFKNLDF